MARTHPNKVRRRGATLVEYTIVIGAVLMLFLAIFEYGRFVMMRHLLDNAAREGARLAVSGTNTKTTTDIQNQVATYLAGQPFGGLNTQVFLADAGGNNIGAWTNAAFGQRIGVQIDCTYTPMLPGLHFLANPVTLRSRAVMRSEAN
jgi:Flp pilus assembly protein TadG